MTNRPAPRKWHDIQIVIATISLALTLVFWNLFAAPDRLVAMKRAQERAALPPTQPAPSTEPTAVQPAIMQPSADGKILLGGSAPQTQIIGQARGGGNNSGGGTGGS
jgi:hypothetical protein